MTKFHPSSYMSSLIFTLILFLTLFLIILIRIHNDHSNPIKLNTTFFSSIKLNLSTNKTIHIPKFMLELYEQNNKNKLNSAEIVQSLIPIHASQITNDENLLIFELPNKIRNEDEVFIGAELRILAQSFEHIEHTIKVSFYDQTAKTFYALEKISFNYVLNNTWIHFNVTKAVANLINSNVKHLKLIITSLILHKTAKSRSKLKLSLMPPEHNPHHNYPILLLSYTSINKTIKNKTRKKRSFEDDYEEESNRLYQDKTLISLRRNKRRNTCRKKTLYVNFEDIEYDVWIVQPKGYEAYQCQGKCYYPVADHLNPTKHAIVQAMLHSLSPSKVSRSCCVPTELDSISVLYVDAHGVLTYRYAYKDMVVVQCGCR